MALLDGLTAKLRYRAVLPSLELAEKLKHRLQVLDAGGGAGSFSCLLKERGHSVVVADLEGGDVRVNLERELPFPDDSFDLVVSLAVVEHLNNWELALKEFQRVARLGVIVTSPTPLAKPVLELLAGLGLVNREHVKDHKVYLRAEDFERLGYATATFLFGLNRVAVWWKNAGVKGR